MNTKQKTFQKYPLTGDACIRGMMSGLATHNKVIQEPLVVRDKDGKPPGGPLAVHCFCVIQEPLLVRDKDRRPPARGPLAVHCFCVIQEPLLVRDKDRRSQEDPWRCTASACVVILRCWEILWSTGPWNVIFCFYCRFTQWFSWLFRDILLC